MTTIILIVIALAIFFTRKLWGKYLVVLVRKIKKQKSEVNIARDMLATNTSVWSPTGTKRTFALAFEIEELGDGTVKFNIVKLKEKDII